MWQNPADSKSDDIFYVHKSVKIGVLPKTASDKTISRSQRLYWQGTAKAAHFSG